MVKCSECGLLALRSLNLGTIDEAPDQFRKVGEYRALGITYNRVPLCFTMRRHFADDVNENSVEAVLTAIQKPINCGAFVKWRPNYTPKEHREMLDREEGRKVAQRQRTSDLRFQLLGLILIALISGLFTIYAAQLQAKTSPTINVFVPTPVLNGGMLSVSGTEVVHPTTASP